MTRRPLARKKSSQGSRPLRTAPASASPRAIMELLVPLMVSAGHSSSELAQEFRRVCAEAKTAAPAWSNQGLTDPTDLAHVLSLWYTDAAYLDPAGRPLAIPLSGPAPSLHSLIKRVYPRVDPVTVVPVLLRMEALRVENQRYRPLAPKILMIERADAVQHALLAVLELLRTATHNCSSSRSSPPLLLQTAINSWIPKRYLPEFHRRVKQHAAELLWEMDRFMRRREWPGALSLALVRVGLGIFAIEHLTGGAVARTRGPSRSQPRRRPR